MNQKLTKKQGYYYQISIFIKSVLRGNSQIMLQENSTTGFLFVLGIFYCSFNMGIAMVLATVCGTTTAYLLKLDRAEIQKGIYGFSAALVGVAVLLFLKPVIFTWAIVMLGAALATIVQHYFLKRTIPVFTFPFVLITWLIIFACSNFCSSLFSDSVSVSKADQNYFAAIFKSYGQVIFQENLAVGILFFIAVFINSARAALYGLFGAILASAISVFFAPSTAIFLGLYGYNAVLCALVFAGNNRKDLFWVSLSVGLSVGIYFLMTTFELMPLTFPFVSAVWLTLLIKNSNLTTKNRGILSENQLQNSQMSSPQISTK